MEGPRSRKLEYVVFREKMAKGTRAEARIPSSEDSRA